MPADSNDAQLKVLRSSISDLAYEIDSYKARTAAALGAGVFLFLLAAGAIYDVIAGKSGIWLTLGVDHETLTWIAIALGASAIILLLTGFVLSKRRNVELDYRLEQMEQEYSELRERGNRGADVESTRTIGSDETQRAPKSGQTAPALARPDSPDHPKA